MELPYRFVVTLLGGEVLRVEPEDFERWSNGTIKVRGREYKVGEWTEVRTEEPS